MVGFMGVLVTVFITDKVMELPVYLPGLYAVALFMLLYNIVLWVHMHFMEGVWATRINANVQIFLDFLSLTILLHFSGGVTNPFMFYYIFHTIFSAILLARAVALVQTLLAIVMFGTLILMEHFEIVKHWSLGIAPFYNLMDIPLYCTGQFFVLVSTLLLALYMTISISERSRRKNVEISAFREQLTRSELTRNGDEIAREADLDSLDKMMSGIAQGMGAPLNALLTNLETALERVENHSPVLDPLETAMEEATRCREMIGQMLVFSKDETGARDLCDAKKLVEDSIALVYNYATLNRVEIESQMPRNMIHCRIDESQMKQVLFNILLNGIQAMPKGGTLKVELAECEGPVVEFSVEDSGKGIPGSIVSRIFDPFFTTRSEGEAAGLGLSVCQRLVALHHGVIDVQSTESKGTRVSVRLPCG